MKDIKVSLICTLKNEESSIREFLDSILSQSRLPDEVVIVDGGSTDKTVEIINSVINSYIGKCGPIKLIVKKGANRAEGRNIAIKNTEYDIIASTDAGCRLDKDWLENLIKPFEDDASVDVVSGWYEADERTEFEKCVAELTYPKLKMVLKNPDKFLPSSRSVAFKKKCWEKVGGYPEQLYDNEDTVFDLNLKKTGCKFTFAPHAVVYWRVRSNLKDIFKQYYLYSRGDGHAKLFAKDYLLIYFPYLLGFILLVSGFVYKFLWILLFAFILYYLLKPTIPVYKRLKTTEVFIVVPFIKLTIDLGHIFGYMVGSIQGVKKRRDLAK